MDSDNSKKVKTTQLKYALKWKWDDYNKNLQT